MKRVSTNFSLLSIPLIISFTHAWLMFDLPLHAPHQIYQSPGGYLVPNQGSDKSAGDRSTAESDSERVQIEPWSRVAQEESSQTDSEYRAEGLSIEESWAAAKEGGWRSDRGSVEGIDRLIFGFSGNFSIPWTKANDQPVLATTQATVLLISIGIVGLAGLFGRSDQQR